jgi:hypothetical protein
MKMEPFTPVLIAIACSQLDILRYLLEEVRLSPLLYLPKPKEQSELSVYEYQLKNPKD